MTTKQRMLKALESAVAHLDNSMEAVDRKSDNSLEDEVWHVAAELEYALFLFSMTIEHQVDKSKWKANPKLKKSEIDQTLGRVQHLLTEAETYVEKEKLSNAYKNAYIARNHLLNLQKKFAKKRREALKKKKGKNK